KAEYTEADDPKRLVELDRLIMDGVALYERGQIAEAMAAYRRVMNARPDMEVAYRRLAFLQAETGQYDAAIATLRDSLAKAGPHIDTDIKLGTYLAEAGRTTEAL